MRDTLDTLGLTETFGAIVTADDVYRGRPDPESYLLAAQQLGRPPVRCVVIGASPWSTNCVRMLVRVQYGQNHNCVSGNPQSQRATRWIGVGLVSRLCTIQIMA